MILGADKVLLRTARKLSDRQRAALVLLVRIGWAEPDRHVAARTLRSMQRLGLVHCASTRSFTLTNSGHTVARLVREAA